MTLISALMLILGSLALAVMIYNLGRDTGYEHAMKNCRLAAKKKKQMQIIQRKGGRR